MAEFDELVEHLFDTYVRAFAQLFPLSGTARRVWDEPDLLTRAAIGAAQESLFLSYECGGRDDGTGGPLVSLIDHGFGDEEYEAVDVARRDVVDFDAADYDGDWIDSGTFILQCAMAFVALRLTEELPRRLDVDVADALEVTVFDEIEATTLGALTPSYYGAMPVDEFLSEFDDHCDDRRYYTYVRRVCQGGWSGDAVELARDVIASADTS